MHRRIFLLSLAGLPAICADPPVTSIRGRLDVTKPVLQLENQQVVALEGDKDTMGVLRDKRLDGSIMELRGKFTGTGTFKVDPIHTHAMHVHKDGKELFVTYWCDVCYIRTYTPGICWCCQKYTELDLRETLDPADASGGQ